MTGVEVLKSLNDEQRAILLNDTPIEHVVKGVQILNRALFVRYFKGYRLQVLGKKRAKQMLEAEAVGKENEELTQLFFTLWNRANGALYHEMYNCVRTINEDVDKIERIEDDKAEEFIKQLLGEFDADRIFMCILFNEVKFSKEVVVKTLDRTITLEVWPPKPEPEEQKGEGGQESAKETTAAEKAGTEEESTPADQK